MPMVAKDGPHYGSNKMMGTGNYNLHGRSSGKQGFGRHRRGHWVGKWFQPFTVDYA